MTQDELAKKSYLPLSVRGFVLSLIPIMSTILVLVFAIFAKNIPDEFQKISDF